MVLFYNESNMNFQEFEVVESGGEKKVYQLESYSDDVSKIEEQAERLMNGSALGVSDYVVRKKEGFYALYIR